MLFRSVQVLESATQIKVGGRGSRIDADSLCDQLDAPLGPAGLDRNNSQQVQRIEVARNTLKHFFVETLGFDELALLMEIQSSLELRLDNGPDRLGPLRRVRIVL